MQPFFAARCVDAASIFERAKVQGDPFYADGTHLNPGMDVVVSDSCLCAVDVTSEGYHLRDRDGTLAGGLLPTPVRNDLPGDPQDVAWHMQKMQEDYRWHGIEVMYLDVIPTRDAQPCDVYNVELVMSTPQTEPTAFFCVPFAQKKAALRPVCSQRLAQARVFVLLSTRASRLRVVQIDIAVCWCVCISETNSLSENVYCRTLHWTCRRFHRRLSASLQKEAAVDNPGVLSPEFSLCSLPPMQVEVCLAVQTAAAEGAPAPPLPVPGSCCVRVWAQPGIEMTFRITLGDGPTAMSRRFDHSFQVPEGEEVPPGSGRVAFEIRNYCQLDQVWVRSSDSLQVTFELLEFTTRPVAQILMLPDLDTIEEKSQGSQAPTEAPPEGDAPEEGEEDAPPEDDMFFTRSGTAELLLHERLQKDLVSIRNRSVRRVEWRVEGCSRLLDFCKVGEAVDSPVFSAGGLERLQFHFYPKGCVPRTLICFRLLGFRACRV
ncbi:unnamed protein product [Symbiodinium microadriaticum]|nr:unnamed protein product [Symbiodinium microadriaticum]